MGVNDMSVNSEASDRDILWTCPKCGVMFTYSVPEGQTFTVKSIKHNCSEYTTIEGTDE